MGKNNLDAMCKNCYISCTSLPCEAYLNLAVLRQVLSEELRKNIDHKIVLQEAYENINEWLKEDE